MMDAEKLRALSAKIERFGRGLKMVERAVYQILGILVMSVFIYYCWRAIWFMRYG